MGGWMGGWGWGEFAKLHKPRCPSSTKLVWKTFNNAITVAVKKFVHIIPALYNATFLLLFWVDWTRRS